MLFSWKQILIKNCERFFFYKILLPISNLYLSRGCDTIGNHIHKQPDFLLLLASKKLPYIQNLTAIR